MINRDTWKWFRVGDLFSLQKCKCSNATEFLEEGEEIAYIGAKKSDNGVMRYVKRVENLVSLGNCIVFIGDGQGSVGYSLYQPVEFIGSTTLIAGYNVHLNPYNAAFLVSVLDEERFRYSFGRKYKKEVIANTYIQLPAIDPGIGGYEPNWQYMEDFVKDHIIPQLPKKAQKVWLQKYDTTPKKQEQMKLNTQDWKWLLPSDIFTEISIAPSSDLNSLELDPFGVNYLSRAVVNNGYECKVKRDESKVTRGNFISVVMVGVPSFAFYQKNDVICSQNILVLRYPAINQYNALFLCTILQKDGYRYSYGRTLSKANFLQTKIKLPVTPSGEPDWQFMEDYIKSLPYSKNLEPSDSNEVVDELVEMKKEMIKMRQAMDAQQNTNLVNYGTVNIYDNSHNFHIK